MQNFILLNLAKAEDSSSGAIASTVSSTIERLGLHSEILTHETTESARIEIGSGVVLLYSGSDREEFKKTLESCHGILVSKPVALIACGDSQTVREVLVILTADHQAFCGPGPLRLNSEDFDDFGVMRDDAADQVRSFIGDFVIFCRAISYYQNNCTQLDEQIEAASRKYEIALNSVPPDHFFDSLRLNHFNVMTKDLEESLAFYSDVLGAKYICHLGPRKVVTSLNGFELFIEEADHVKIDENVHLGVRSDRKGVLAFVNHLKSLGIPLVAGNSPLDRPHLDIDGERAAIYFRDPAGLLIEVYSAQAMTLRIEEAERKRFTGGETRAPAKFASPQQERDDSLACRRAWVRSGRSTTTL